MTIHETTLRPISTWLCASALACAMISAGCDKKTSDATATKPGAVNAGTEADFKAGSKAEVFTSVLESDPETFDTTKMSGAPEGRLAFNLFEGLLVPGPTTEGLEDTSKLVRPGVAESFDVSEDGRTYTFRLRQNATWSDKTPLTSEDFVYTWKKMLTPGYPADYVNMLWVIDGAQAFNEGKTDDWNTVGVKAPDDHTLEVTLAQPTPYFPELVAFYPFFPIPQHVVEEHGDAWTKPEHIVTNGAYTLASYTPQQEAVLKKREGYWDAANVALDTIRLRIITDRNAVVNAYKTGELHWSGTSLPVSQIASLLMHPDYRKEPMLGTYYYRVNVSKPGPLQDNRVRQALSMAVDRTQLVDQSLKGLYEPAMHYVPKMPGYTSTSEIGGNSKKAKKMLEEAGYGEDNPLKVTLLYNTDENHKIVAEALQAMWKDLGVQVELENKEWKTYLQDIDTLSYEIARAGWIGDYNDPMTFLDMWVTGNGNNDTGWSNAEYDRLIKEAASTTDATARGQMLQKAEAILLAEGPIIPIYFYTNNLLASRQIEGLSPTTATSTCSSTCRSRARATSIRGAVFGGRAPRASYFKTL